MLNVTANQVRHLDETEVWILGSGTAVLASAVYLVQDAKIHPSKVHIINPNESLEGALHDAGDHLRGYDQFARCLPVPIGLPLKELLGSIPSGVTKDQTILGGIETREARRASRSKGRGTDFLIKRGETTGRVSTRRLDLDFGSRIRLLSLMLKKEEHIKRGQIRDYLPDNFFNTAFWAIWSAQFGLQPWHSAVEFRRALRQYFPTSRKLNLLNCLDITGYYQYEAIFLPLYFFLQSLGVDFQFGIKVKDILLSSEGKRKVIGLDVIKNGIGYCQGLGPDDIVLMNLGSTVSGSTTGFSNHPPPRQSMEADEELNENWSIWLNLRSKSNGCGDPYSFCTRQSESLMESFTVTVKDVALFEQFKAFANCTGEAGTFIVLQESRWKLHICVPLQPFFSHQPKDIRVLWGFSNMPLCKGDFIKKPMVQCSGDEILTEVLRHLDLDVDLFLHKSITVPRLMPRMSAALLSRVRSDRPEVIPPDIMNVGFMGSFVEIPQHSTVDISYEIRTAQKAISELLGIKVGHSGRCMLPMSTLFKILFGK